MEKPVAKHKYKFIVPNSKTTISKLPQSEEFNFWKPDEILKQWWMANELSTLFSRYNYIYHSNNVLWEGFV